MQTNPPRIPGKFQEKGFPGESVSQISRRNQLEKFKVEMEIERLEEEGAKHDSIVSSLELDMQKLCSETNDPGARQLVKEYWFENVKIEEEKSDKIWENKKSIFEDDNHYKKYTQNKSVNKLKSKNQKPLRQDAMGELISKMMSSFGNHQINTNQIATETQSMPRPFFRPHRGRGRSRGGVRGRGRM